jgi:hypothetical protein
MSRRGLGSNALDARPGGLAPAETRTSFRWSLEGVPA